MEQVLLLSLMIMLGFGLGVLFFLGLWLTIKTLPAKKQWGLKIFVSLVVRVSLVAVAFFYLMDHDWKRILALVAGFWLARYLIVRRFKTYSQQSRISAA